MAGEKEKENPTGDKPGDNGEEKTQEQKDAEAKAVEDKTAADVAGGGDAGDPLDEFDYSGVIEDKDKMDMDGEKVSYAEAKKRNALYKKHKDTLDKLEKDPEFLNKLAKQVEPDPGKGAPAAEMTADKKVQLQLLRDAFDRKWEDIKEKYPLVEKDEVVARILSVSNPDLDQVEAQAKMLQQYFDKKLTAKEKLKIKLRNDADDIDPQGGAGPTAGAGAGKAKDADTGLEDLGALTREAEEATSKH